MCRSKSASERCEMKGKGPPQDFDLNNWPVEEEEEDSTAEKNSAAAAVGRHLWRAVAAKNYPRLLLLMPRRGRKGSRA